MSGTSLIEHEGHPKLQSKDSINRLQGLVKQLQDKSELPKAGFISDSPLIHPPVITEKNVDAIVKKKISDEELNSDHGDLENSLLIDLDDVMSLLSDADDSWLYESSQKSQTPQKSKEVWMKENVSTPELLRVRGALSAKLEVLAIESRQDQFTKIQNRRSSKHSRHGSATSLDWDYDEDDLSVGGSPGLDDHGLPGDAFFATSSPYIGVAHSAAVDNRKLKRTASSERSDRSILEDVNILPMQLNFDSGTKHVIKTGRIPAIRRSGSDLIVIGPSSRKSLDGDEYFAKPSGAVRARRTHSQDSDKDLSIHEITLENVPILLESKLMNVDGPVRVRGSPDKSANLRLRGSTSAMKQSHSAGDLATAVKRRGVPSNVNAVSEVLANDNLLGSAAVRAPGIPVVRKTQGLPGLKSPEVGIVRPRRSKSPAAVARPRGQAAYNSDM